MAQHIKTKTTELQTEAATIRADTGTEINRFAQREDAALAQEMNALTVEEREQIFEEIHGIATIIEETPELIASSLQQMRLELARIPRRKGGLWTAPCSSGPPSRRMTSFT